MKFSGEKEQNILKLYNEGHSQKDIAALYNTFNTSIRRVLLRNNIVLRANTDIQSFVRNDLFNDLESPIVNYWLGWLVSDGCVHNTRITLQLQEQDLQVIKNFKEFLGNKVKIKTITHSKFKTIGYRIDFRKKAIVHILNSYGITSNKSKTIKIKIPITYSLLLGIFEGDGSFIFLGKNKNQAKFSILSASKILIVQLFDFLTSEGFTPTITKIDRNPSNAVLYNLNLYKKAELIKLYTNLYKDVPYFLARKKEKFGSFVEKSTM